MNNSNFICMMVAIAALVIVGLFTPAMSQDRPVTDVCLGCICEAISGCNQTKTCNGDVCGLFRITWAYWSDGGKLTTNGESSQSQSAFQNCVNDPYCAADTIQNYMRKFGQDCNGDSQIDCYDYAAIHMLGGYGCQSGITGSYAAKLNQCLAAFSPNGK
ncbi:lysozyme-like [Episyrphus balteatus]|uniref:lysozyme-like n=1 Tax=Episyrphus balteatus TaxID=286459 RepID=UPI00248698E7|nr:lysozyme-like [Episyrphus balteatus]